MRRGGAGEPCLNTAGPLMVREEAVVLEHVCVSGVLVIVISGL